MSINDLAFTPVGNRRPGNAHGSSSLDHDPYQRRQSSIPRPLYYSPVSLNSKLQLPVATKFTQSLSYMIILLTHQQFYSPPCFHLGSFPSQPHSPIRILILDSGMTEQVNPRLRQFINESPPRIRSEWNLAPAQEPEEPALTKEELKKVMKKLKKQIYVPPYPRRKARKKGLFSNWNGRSTANSSITNSINVEGEQKEEEKTCAICLEAFVLNEQVLVTPCNHMFHEDCLIPWVRSHVQCPVCRFAFCERSERREAVIPLNSSSYSYNTRGMGEDDLAVDLISLIRAMDEAFNWVVHSS